MWTEKLTYRDVHKARVAKWTEKQKCFQLCAQKQNSGRVRDMAVLTEKHPHIYAEFMNVNFIVQQSARKSHSKTSNNYTKL